MSSGKKIYAKEEKNIRPVGKKHMPSRKKKYSQCTAVGKNICQVGKKYMPNGKKIYAQ